MESVKSAALPGAILQIKIRLLGISPMIWRRVLVPESMSLRELHGVVQLAMGWEGIHLFEFAVRGVRYAGPDLSGMSTPSTVSSTASPTTARSPSTTTAGRTKGPQPCMSGHARRQQRR